MYIDQEHQRLLEAPAAQPLALTWGGDGNAMGADDDAPAAGCEHIGGCPAELFATCWAPGQFVTCSAHCWASRGAAMQLTGSLASSSIHE